MVKHKHCSKGDADDYRFVHLNSIHHICAFGAGVQRAITCAESEKGTGSCCCDLDLHADTCVVGSNMLLISDSKEAISVIGFASELEMIKNVPIGTAATLYQHPDMGKVYCLIFHQVLYFGD